jgi:hypothetical protein
MHSDPTAASEHNGSAPVISQGTLLGSAVTECTLSQFETILRTGLIWSGGWGEASRRRRAIQKRLGNKARTPPAENLTHCKIIRQSWTILKTTCQAQLGRKKCHSNMEHEIYFCSFLLDNV